MTKKRHSGRGAWVVSMMSLAILALGCGSSATTPSGHTSATASGPVSGGSMTIIDGSDLKTWSPFTTNTTFPGSPMDELDAVYGVLVWQNVNDQIVGDMAESLTTTDNITWTLKLRPNLKFTDGTAFNAAAVKFNYDWAANPTWGATSQAWIASWDPGIKVVDATTLTIKLPAANADFATQIANLAPFIASPKALGAASTLAAIKPVGAGAFKLLSWDPGVNATVVRNPGYWDQPRPYLNSIIFVDIAATPSRIATVVQGEATMMAGYPYQWGSQDTSPGVTDTEIPMQGLFYGYLNTAKGFFSNPQARRFLYEAVNPLEVMAAFTQVSTGYGAPTTYFSSASPYYDSSLTFPKYNATAAQALLSQIKASGVPMSVQIVSTVEPDTERLGGYIAQALSTYGITVTQTYIDQTILVQRCQSQLAFDICIPGGALVFNGPEPYSSQLFSPNGTLNMSGYNSSAMNTALAATQSATGKTALFNAWQSVQKTLMQDLPIYVYGTIDRYLLIRNNTGGLVYSDGGMLQKQFLYLCPNACDAPASPGE
jgi:peptide/nickel transport system substrate-binding protein